MPKITGSGVTRSVRFQVSVAPDVADLLDKLAEVTGQPRYVCASLALSMGAKMLLETFASSTPKPPVETSPEAPITSVAPFSISGVNNLPRKQRGKR